MAWGKGGAVRDEEGGGGRSRTAEQHRGTAGQPWGAAHLQFAVIQARQRHILHFHLQLLAEKSRRTLIAQDTRGSGCGGEAGAMLAPRPWPADPQPPPPPAQPKLPPHALGNGQAPGPPRCLQAPGSRVLGLSPPGTWGGHGGLPAWHPHPLRTDQGKVGEGSWIRIRCPAPASSQDSLSFPGRDGRSPVLSSG